MKLIIIILLSLFIHSTFASTKKSEDALGQCSSSYAEALDIQNAKLSPLQLSGDQKACQVQLEKAQKWTNYAGYACLIGGTAVLFFMVCCVMGCCLPRSVALLFTVIVIGAWIAAYFLAVRFQITNALYIACTATYNLQQKANLNII